VSGFRSRVADRRITAQSSAAKRDTAPNVIPAWSFGKPFVPPPDPFGAKAAGVYFAPPVVPSVYASAAGIPFVPPPDPFGARAAFTPPLVPTVRFASQDGNGPVFPPDPFGAQSFLTYSTPPQRLLFGQRGSGPIFPPAPFGADASFTPPLIPTTIIAMSAGSRAVFPPDAYGARAFLTTDFFALVIPRLPMSAGSGPIFPDAPFGARSALTIPLLPTRNYRPQQSGADFRGGVERGFSLSFTTISPPPPPFVQNMGGGGDWIIWTKPYFPGNDPGNWQRFPKPNFRKPTRRVP